MVTVAIAVLVIVAAIIVGWPFVRAAAPVESQPESPRDAMLENLMGQRDTVYAAIKDLEADHLMGKLSDGDYRAMRGKCETQAVAVLKELDSIRPASGAPVLPAGSDEGIEQEVRRLRRRGAAVPAVCPKCGTTHTADDAFCGKCGSALRGARCPTCGTRAALGDKFCARCGARIKG